MPGLPSLLKWPVKSVSAIDGAAFVLTEPEAAGLVLKVQKLWAMCDTSVHAPTTCPMPERRSILGSLGPPLWGRVSWLASGGPLCQASGKGWAPAFLHLRSLAGLSSIHSGTRSLLQQMSLGHFLRDRTPQSILFPVRTTACRIGLTPLFPK